MWGYTMINSSKGSYYNKKPTQIPPSYTPLISAALHPKDAKTLQNNINCIIYVWLHNTREFWYFLITPLDNFIDGYIWMDNQWVRSKIPIESVKTYY